MNSAVEAIARTVLYEGYILYPYRESAAKNRHRWTPGGLLPRSNDPGPSSLRAECLVRGDANTTLAIRVRFLHSLLRTGGDALPLRSSRLVEMHVRVHDSGEHVPVGRVERGKCCL